MNERATAGKYYERLAARDCRRRGYRILAANRRVKGGEIDLLAEDEAGTLVLVEVRGREQGYFRPSRWLPEAKRRRLLRLAENLVAATRRPVRVELVEIVGKPRRWWPWPRPFLRVFRVT